MANLYLSILLLRIWERENNMDFSPDVSIEDFTEELNKTRRLYEQLPKYIQHKTQIAAMQQQTFELFRDSCFAMLPQQEKSNGLRNRDGA